jgi:choline dehydrogenase
MIEAADYVIVGAGSAGCVLASELSKDPGTTVLLVESGPSDKSFMVDMPRGIALLLSPTNPRMYAYEVSKGGNRGSEVWMKGHTVGGSSSVNGMIYARGSFTDYDGWEQDNGCPGWGWDKILPLYKKMEDHELGAGPTRGVGGPLRISVQPRISPLYEAVLDAAAEAGTRRVEDCNDVGVEGGMGYSPRTIWKGRRQSAAKAFLRPALSRPNLHVMTDTNVLRLVFEGTRISGVEILHGGETRRIAVRGEAIVCGGAIESPKLLQLSGVGPAERLRGLGIEVVADRPNVGRNLREHIYLPVSARVKGGSLNPQFAGPRLFANLLRYVLASSGPMTLAAHELIGYARTRPGLARPDVQIGVGLYSIGVGPKGLTIDSAPGMTIGGYFMHPQSQGETYIQSPDPLAAPFVNANYLAEQEDRDAAVATVRHIRSIYGQPALKPYFVEELTPGPTVETDEQILEMFRESGGTAFHVAGTCRMGSDADSVVDPQTRVRGVQGVRVVDTSIFPTLVSGNTNAPAMVAGMRAAEIIRAGA